MSLLTFRGGLNVLDDDTIGRIPGFLSIMDQFSIMTVFQKNTACENAYNNLVNDSRNEGASKKHSM